MTCWVSLSRLLSGMGGSSVTRFVLSLLTTPHSSSQVACAFSGGAKTPPSSIINSTASADLTEIVPFTTCGFVWSDVTVYGRFVFAGRLTLKAGLDEFHAG